MQIDVKPGTYIVAVSGGVDSMALLHMLRSLPGLKLIVAHFDHGIRVDSDEDRKLVAATTRDYDLAFEYERGNLGHAASEATARAARYAFLRDVQKHYNAQAIITAHHQDDWIETAVINMKRGTGRRGLSSLRSTPAVLRPLLTMSKQEIQEYAKQHALAWREDSTNLDDAYLRNYIRHHVLPVIKEQGIQFVEHLKIARTLNEEIDTLLNGELDNHAPHNEMDRRWFVMLPYDVSCEVMASWLRRHGVREFDKKTIARLVVAAKVAKPGKQADINAEYLLNIGRGTVGLLHRSFSQ